MTAFPLFKADLPVGKFSWKVQILRRNFSVAFASNQSWKRRMVLFLNCCGPPEETAPSVGGNDMKRFFAVSGLLLAGVFVLGLISFAPMGVSWGHGPGWGSGLGAGRGPGIGPGRGAGPRHFDSSALQTITGKVVTYETVAGFGPHGVKAVTVESEGKSHTIMLGPEFYLTDEKLSLKEGDEVSIVASPAGYRTKTFFVAKSVKVGEKTLALRDEAGFPVWRGQGRRFGNSRGPGRGMGPGMMGPGRGPARMLPPGQ